MRKGNKESSSKSYLSSSSGIPVFERDPYPLYPSKETRRFYENMRNQILTCKNFCEFSEITKSYERYNSEAICNCVSAMTDNDCLLSSEEALRRVEFLINKLDATYSFDTSCYLKITNKKLPVKLWKPLLQKGWNPSDFIRNLSTSDDPENKELDGVIIFLTSLGISVEYSSKDSVIMLLESELNKYFPEMNVANTAILRDFRQNLTPGLRKVVDKVKDDSLPKKPSFFESSYSSLYEKKLFDKIDNEEIDPIEEIGSDFLSQMRSMKKSFWETDKYILKWNNKNKNEKMIKYIWKECKKAISRLRKIETDNQLFGKMRDTLIKKFEKRWDKIKLFVEAHVCPVSGIFFENPVILLPKDNKSQTRCVDMLSIKLLKKNDSFFCPITETPLKTENGSIKYIENIEYKAMLEFTLEDMGHSVDKLIKKIEKLTNKIEGKEDSDSDSAIEEVCKNRVDLYMELNK